MGTATIPTHLSAAPALAPAPAPSRTAPISDHDRLTALLRRAESGQLPTAAEAERLTHATDAATRGLARRLLAITLVHDANRLAAGLLAESCADLEYQYPDILAEAVHQAESLGLHDDAFELRLRRAEACAARDEHVPALVSMFNAAACGFRHSAARFSDLHTLRRMIAVYERVARRAMPAQVRPAARSIRRSPRGEPLRLAHITCQLVDGGHSTSRCVETLLRHRDHARYRHYLVLTESLAQHDRHAHQAIHSDPSAVRGAARIRAASEQFGATVLLPRTRESYIAAAADLHAQLAEHRIDIAFFHGSIATPTDWLLCAWRAAPWQVDRGFGVPLYCPALDYQFFEFAESMEKLGVICTERGVPIGHSPHGGIDLSHVAAAAPIPREALGIPPSHVIVGTVGNHLPARMSEPFCRAVASVLRRVPTATWLVVGPGDFHRQRAWMGDELCASAAGGAARVIFTGASAIPDRVTRTLDIYANEYPEGGGASVLEAMAAGKPVVAMRGGDSGPALAGATYVGAEHVVHPATDAAYAARLLTLLTDPAARTRCGAAMHQRYQSEFDGRKWVGHMMDRVWQLVHCGGAG